MAKSIISIKNLTTEYNGNIILDDISTEIYPGEITIILGGSGCGKTTLIKNILRLKEPHKGTVRIFNTMTSEMEWEQFEQILKRVGMLFQNGALLNSVSVFDNVAIPLEQHTDLPASIIERIIYAKLALVNLKEAAYLRPSELSGGMRKRAALARAMVLDPEILFCDEPSAGLDPVTSAALDELILKMKRQLQMTMVIVTHELASIHRIADRILFLEQGKILFQGTLAEAKQSDQPAIQQFFKSGTF